MKPRGMGSRCETLEPRQLLTRTIPFTFNGGAPVILTTDSDPNMTIYSSLVPFGQDGVFVVRDNVVTRYYHGEKVDRRFAGGALAIADPVHQHDVLDVFGELDGSLIVERNLNGRTSDFGLQHYLKTGRLDRSFGLHGLLDFNAKRHGATNAQPLLFAAAESGDLYGIVENFSASFVPTSQILVRLPASGKLNQVVIGPSAPLDAEDTDRMLLPASDGSVYVVGNGVTRYEPNLARSTTFGNSGTVLPNEAFLSGYLGVDEGR